MPFDLAVCCFLKRETPEGTSGRGNMRKRKSLCKRFLQCPGHTMCWPSLGEGLCFSSLELWGHWEPLGRWLQGEQMWAYDAETLMRALLVKELPNSEFWRHWPCRELFLKKRKGGDPRSHPWNHSHNLLSKWIIRLVNPLWSLHLLYCPGIISSWFLRTKNVCLVFIVDGFWVPAAQMTVNVIETSKFWYTFPDHWSVAYLL